MRTVLVFSTAKMLALSGCLIPFGDPPGPGASGRITLGQGVDQAAYQSLQLRVFSDEAAQSGRVLTLPNKLPGALAIPLKEVRFPYEYRVTEVLGVAEFQRWRAVAWLSVANATEAQPTAVGFDEPFATATFELRDCGTYGGYCDTTAGVDLTLAR